MSAKVRIAPPLYEWALARSRKTVTDLEKNFPKLPEWISGVSAPSFTDAKKFAAKTNTPFAFLFLDTPPEENLPIADMRTLKDSAIHQPSGDLLDTVYNAQRTQDWYRDYALSNGAEKLSFVGSVGVNDNVSEVAAEISDLLDFGFDSRKRIGNMSSLYRYLVDKIEELGILVLTNGVVGNNTHRKLRVEEFRGFSLSDEIAPLIFVNGADGYSARIFTLLHELGHIWLGHSALSDADLSLNDSNSAKSEERWCNQLAGEILLPKDVLEGVRGKKVTEESVTKLAREAGCSVLVALHSLFDVNFLSWSQYQDLYGRELSAIAERGSKGKQTGGGDFYKTLPLRNSPTFTRAVIVSTLEGNTLYRDAFRMLGTKKPQTFRNLAEKLAVG